VCRATDTPDKKGLEEKVMSSASQQFDAVAQTYKKSLDESITISGERGEYFAEVKARHIAVLMGREFHGKMLDFGCGVGMLSHFLVQHLPFSKLHGYDISEVSIEKIDPRVASHGRFTSDKRRLDSDYDLVVMANVMHHVSISERAGVIAELRDRLAPFGKLVVFEHNPANPATRWAVNHCSFDADAVLLWPKEVHGYFEQARLQLLTQDYIVFFPRWFAWLRPMERSLRWCPLGAQYAIVGQK
jgi:2-polyprenyl-3-methyl-5-hydroxy-6-metoxy-1,4-benzoquinol methylase